MRLKHLIPSLLLASACVVPAAVAQNAVTFTSAATLTNPDALAFGTATAGPAEPKKPVTFDLSSIDKTANPCTDFYQYACGNWVKNNPIPADQVRWGRFNELAERNRWLLYQDLKKAASAPATPLQVKYGNFFAACMDQPLADKLGDTPIQPLLAEVAALKDKKELTPLIAKLQSQQGVAVLFEFGSAQDDKNSTKEIAMALQGGLGLPDRDYYLQNDDRSKKIREQYVEHVADMFKLAGDTPEEATVEAKRVMTLETALAQASTSRVDLRVPANHYHIMTVSELDTLSPAFQWNTYFSAMGLSNMHSLNVATPNFFKEMSQQIHAADMDTWKSYLRWHVIHSAAPYLSDAFVQANFHFYREILSGQKELAPRWKRCTALTDHAMGEAVGQDWVKQNFPPDAKQSMTKLVKSLEVSLNEDIKNLPWMTAQTKVEAEKKLDAIRNKIGYPDQWRDYSKLTVERNTLFANVQRSDAFEFHRDLNKIGKPVDEKEWGMTPPTVNAYYDPNMNDINFPAGILQPPFFDNSKDAAVNYGAIGVVIGHEMTHGFDDEGSQYDADGNLKNWWTPADKKAFAERTDCEVKEYGNFEAAPGAKLNGQLTLGENTADNGGLRIAYMALMNTLAQEGKQAESKKIDGYTPAQRFFISYAQVWCSNQTEQSARLMTKVDPHSPGKWRTNGAVQNFDGFGKAFGCTKGQPMMPVNACRVW
ncbi:MAG: M13 family metallopeptidase [Acidobacteriaceae bacterium]